MNNKKKKRLKQKLKIGAAATIVSASILLGASVEDPSSLIDSSDDDSNHIVIEDNQKTGFMETMVHRIPLVIRCLLLIPLWALGNLLIHILNPFKNVFLEFLLTFLVMTFIFVIIMKMLFPDMKLKDILNRKNLIILLLSSLGITVFNRVMIIINEDYRHYVAIFRFSIGIIILSLMLRPFIKLKRKIDSIIIPDIDSI